MSYKKRLPYQWPRLCKQFCNAIFGTIVIAIYASILVPLLGIKKLLSLPWWGVGSHSAAGSQPRAQGEEKQNNGWKADRVIWLECHYQVTPEYT